MNRIVDIIADKPMISIVVPVYKAEPYLRRCVDSILAQNFTDFELILVDDGSPDKSGIICDEYAQKDTRVRIIHKKNGGVSSARNAGIEVARGDWLCFVDSDDYLEKEYLSDFRINQDCQSDLYMQGYKVFDSLSNKQEVHAFQTDEFKGVLEVLAEAEDNYIINSPCFKLFLRRIVVENSIRFDPKVSYGEDHLFSLSYYVYVKSCSKSTAVGYVNMRNGNESLTRRSVPLQEMMYYITEMRRLHELIIKMNSDIDKSIEPAINNRFVKNIKKAFFDILSRDNMKLELTELKFFLKKYMPKIMIGTSLKDRAFVMMILCLPTFLIVLLIKR
jgi:glycosyltransferase involved in cell wall biosynthesis